LRRGAGGSRGGVGVGRRLYKLFVGASADAAKQAEAIQAESSRYNSRFRRFTVTTSEKPKG